jgi:hypothetical protein
MARVISEKIWHSTKIANIQPKEWRPEYAWLVAIAFVDGTFEADARDIWARAYAYSRPDWSAEMVAQLLDELERVGLIQRVKDADGRVWGFFTGSDNFTPPPSKKSHYKAGKRSLFSAGADAVKTLCTQGADAVQTSCTPGVLHVQEEFDSDFDFDSVSVSDSVIVPACKSGEQAGACVSESESLSPKSDKQRWVKFVTDSTAALPDAMRCAEPTGEERKKVLAQLDEIGAEALGLAISGWAEQQSPPLRTLEYGRWKRWLETGVNEFEAYKS